MSIPMLREPSPEEVIELLQRLKTKNELRRRYLGITLGVLISGLVLFVFGSLLIMSKGGSILLLISSLPLLLGGFVSSSSLVSPQEIMRIARRLEKSNNPNILPPLIDALETAQRISANSNIIKQLRKSVSVLLLRLSVDDSVVLTDQNWEVLRKHLCLNSLFTVDSEELALTYSILDLIKRRRDTHFIATISNISLPSGEKGIQLREAVWDCLAVLQEQKRKEDESKILLRASQPKSQSETLLRPAGYTDTTQAQELLRPDNKSSL